MISPDVMDRVMRRLGAIPFFPSDESDRLVIMEAICAFARSPDALERAARAAVLHVDRWQGIPPLRALYESEVEQAAIERESAHLRGQLDEWKAERRLLGGDVAPPQVEPVFEGQIIKRIPTPRAETRTERNLRAIEADHRLADIAGGPARPVISFRGTPVRTPEERAKLEAELADRVRQYQQTTRKVEPSK